MKELGSVGVGLLFFLFSFSCFAEWEISSGRGNYTFRNTEPSEVLERLSYLIEPREARFTVQVQTRDHGLPVGTTAAKLRGFLEDSGLSPLPPSSEPSATHDAPDSRTVELSFSVLEYEKVERVLGLLNQFEPILPILPVNMFQIILVGVKSHCLDYAIHHDHELVRKIGYSQMKFNSSWDINLDSETFVNQERTNRLARVTIPQEFRPFNTDPVSIVIEINPNEGSVDDLKRHLASKRNEDRKSGSFVPSWILVKRDSSTLEAQVSVDQLGLIEVILDKLNTYEPIIPASAFNLMINRAEMVVDIHNRKPTPTPSAPSSILLSPRPPIQPQQDPPSCEPSQKNCSSERLPNRASSSSSWSWSSILSFLLPLE